MRKFRRMSLLRATLRAGLLLSALLSLSAGAQSKPELLPAKIETASKAAEPALTVSAPPGSALYVAKRGDSIPLVARHYLGQSSFLTSTELAEAIRKANPGATGTFLKAGQQVVVPGLLSSPIVEKMVPVQRDFEVRAIYLTGVMAASDRGLRIVRRWHEVGGNAVVFDI